MKELQREHGNAVDVQSVDAQSGRSALHKAAFWGHVHVVKHLLANGVEVNRLDYTGDTPLHDASRFGHTRIVVALLEAGADLTIKNKDGLTAHAIAAEHGKMAVESVLNKCAAKVRRGRGRSWRRAGSSN